MSSRIALLQYFYFYVVIPNFSHGWKSAGVTGIWKGIAGDRQGRGGRGGALGGREGGGKGGGEECRGGDAWEGVT